MFLLFSITSPVFAQVTIDNGVAGDGFWAVDVLNAGDSRVGVIDPVGGDGPTDVIFAFRAYYDNGKDGFDGLLRDSTTTPAFLSGPGEVTSSGTFPGNGITINWTSVATIAPGSPIYRVDLQFSSSVPFGDTRIISYLDEDVIGFDDDIGVELGTDGTDDFLLLTVDNTEDIGVSHSVGYATASNMTYIGWQFKDCCLPGNDFSISPGQIVDLTPAIDLRYPGAPAYGPDDITSSFAFDFDPQATTASVTFLLGGSADGGRPAPVNDVPVPMMSKPATLVLFFTMLLLAALAFRTRKFNMS